MNTLFPVAPAPEPVKVSRDVARRLRAEAMIAAGMHPLTRLRLLPDSDHTCGDCALAEKHNRWWKCGRMRSTNGAATDLRLKWPACSGWTAREP